PRMFGCGKLGVEWKLRLCGFGNEQPLHSASEREAEANLSDPLLRLLEVAGEAGGLHEGRARRAADQADRLHDVRDGTLEVGRVDRVEQVEDLPDRLDIGAAEQMERARDPQVHLRERRAAAAV